MKMKWLPLLALTGLLFAGCAHRKDICGNWFFAFFQGEVRRVEANFRDHRLLHSDVIVRGLMTEWHPNPMRKGAHAYFTVSLELEAAESIKDIRVTVDQGSYGGSYLASIPIFQAETFAGGKQLASFDICDDNRDANLTLWFRRGDGLKRVGLSIHDLWMSGTVVPPEEPNGKDSAPAAEPSSGT
jgi:hypothetical protein